MTDAPAQQIDPERIDLTPELKVGRRPRHLWIWILVGLATFVVGGIVVLGLLATLVVPNVLQKFAFASRKKAEVDITAIEGALKEFSIANGGKFPDNLEVLVTPDLNGHTYLEGHHLPKDPWGHEYLYEPPGPGQPQPIVRSYGKDGQPGGEGDDADMDNLTLRREFDQMERTRPVR